MSECYKQILIKSEGCGNYPYCVIDDNGTPMNSNELYSLKVFIDDNPERFTIPQCDKPYNTILIIIVAAIFIFYLMLKGGK